MKHTLKIICMAASVLAAHPVTAHNYDDSTVQASMKSGPGSYDRDLRPNYADATSTNINPRLINGAAIYRNYNDGMHGPNETYPSNDQQNGYDNQTNSNTSSMNRNEQ